MQTPLDDDTKLHKLMYCLIGYEYNLMSELRAVIIHSPPFHSLIWTKLAVKVSLHNWRWLSLETPQDKISKKV